MSVARLREWPPTARVGQWLISFVLLNCAVVLLGPSDAATPLVMAGAVVAVIALLALASIPAEPRAMPGANRRLSRFARNCSGLTRQCDPDAAGHVRSRAPGSPA